MEVPCSVCGTTCGNPRLALACLSCIVGVSACMPSSRHRSFHCSRTHNYSCNTWTCLYSAFSLEVIWHDQWTFSRALAGGLAEIAFSSPLSLLSFPWCGSSRLSGPFDAAPSVSFSPVVAVRITIGGVLVFSHACHVAHPLHHSSCSIL